MDLRDRYQELAAHEDPLSVLLSPALEKYLYQARHQPKVHKKALLAYQKAAALFESVTHRAFGLCWPRYLDWRDLYDDSFGTANVVRAVEVWVLSQDSF